MTHETCLKEKQPRGVLLILFTIGTKSMLLLKTMNVNNVPNAAVLPLRKAVLQQPRNAIFAKYRGTRGAFHQAFCQ